MATESIEVSGVVHAPAERIYQAWLSSIEHTAMTGSRAEVEGNVGGRFTAYDGRIEGAMVELEPGRRIVQRWRSTDFPSDAGDSLLEVRLEPVDNGTRVAFVHSEIPEGQATQLEEGWRKYYLEPMDRYFATISFVEVPEEAESPAQADSWEAEPKPAPKKAPPQKAAPKKKAAAKKAKPKPAAKKAAPRRAKKAKAARRSARKGGAKKAKGKAKRSSRRGKR